MDPMKYLMKACDDKARKALETKNNESEENNMKKVGNQCIATNDEMIDTPVREVIQIIGTIESDDIYLYGNNAEH